MKKQHILVRLAARLARRQGLIAFLLLAHLLGLATSLHALMTVRTPQGTIAWMVTLNTIPYVAVPAYWVFGRTKFQGYVISRRDVDSALATDLADTFEIALEAHGKPAPADFKDLRAIERLARMPLIGSNHLELLIDGHATFASLFAGIDAATDYILVQFYIIRDDEIGRLFQQRLIERAQEGVDIYLLYDEIGSYRLPASYVRKLTDAGVNVRRFHSTRGSGNRFQVNFRNHRKVMVVDGRQAWIGGLNLGDEYLGADDQTDYLRDTHLAVTGPAALAAQMSFVEDWHWATRDILELPWDPIPSTIGDVPVLIVPSGPADRFETASLMIQQAIHAAHERIWISSPYFVPDEGVQGMLKLAALGDIDVRILIPEMPDNKLTYFAAYAFLGPLLDAGVQIYRYENGFLHGKAFLVDDIGAGIGTVNLDNRSFRLNFEITAIGYDPEFAAEVERMFLADFERSRLMQPGDVEQLPFWLRAASRASYLFSPIL